MAHTRSVGFSKFEGFERFDECAHCIHLDLDALINAASDVLCMFASRVDEDVDDKVEADEGARAREGEDEDEAISLIEWRGVPLLERM